MPVAEAWPLVAGTWALRHSGVFTTPCEEYPGGLKYPSEIFRASPSRLNGSNSPSGEAGAQMSSAMRACSEVGTPQKKSASNGAASSRNAAPGIAPLARRTISPTRCP